VFRTSPQPNSRTAFTAGQARAASDMTCGANWLQRYPPW